MRRVLSIGVMLIALLAPAAAGATSYAFYAFFDRDSTVLDDKATVIVQLFAKHCQPAGTYRIGLTGHTDTAGSAASNMALSLRRAEVVKQALISMGIPAEVIFVAGRGEAQGLIQTGDDVWEPQNRRVELICSR